MRCLLRARRRIWRPAPLRIQKSLSWKENVNWISIRLLTTHNKLHSNTKICIDTSKVGVYSKKQMFDTKFCQLFRIKRRNFRFQIRLFTSINRLGNYGCDSSVILISQYAITLHLTHRIIAKFMQLPIYRHYLRCYLSKCVFWLCVIAGFISRFI